MLANCKLKKKQKQINITKKKKNANSMESSTIEMRKMNCNFHFLRKHILRQKIKKKCENYRRREKIKN